MIIAGRHICRVGHDRRAVIRLDDLIGAQRVEPLGEAAREHRRHVLHDEHRGAAPGRQRGHEVGEGARATRRRRNRDGEPRPGPEPQLRSLAHRHGRPREHRDARDVGCEGRAHRFLELRREPPQRFFRRGCRFRDDFDGAELQGADRGGGAGPRVRAHDDDGPRRLGHDVADRAEPIELGHLEVHRDDVGRELVHLAHRVEAVARGGDDAERPVAAEDVGEDAPHQGAVVHDEDGGFPLR